MTPSMIASVLVIAAATSSRPVLDALRPDLEKAAGGPVEIRYGETGNLASALRKAPDADLFLASDEKTVQKLAGDGFVVETTVTRCATGSLAVVAVRGGTIDLPRRLDGATALAFVKLPIRHLALVSKKFAPEGALIEEVLAAALILREMKEKLLPVPSSDEAIALVLSGGAEAAIIPSSLAAAPRRRSCPVDPPLHEPLRQTAAVVAASTRKEAAGRALDVLSAPEARETWRRFGFAAP
jgi:molybdate transport system substrate-binding protein